ncbi:MAG TPA: ribonuclease Z [Chitinophagales bacterium]|nr:ribonuclease Z [Chitinophagales bacterium]HMX03047.1 ribonuclease Z [Chitinophagales bacterium]HMZ88530.1 ribonuclease Z [Chitinophagales bacterium]HNA57239.1 ribonuclease Z [Chitinophagales bacterium]HNE45818.1 ribonuclease Z [Chitinophagales bacterium]
MSFAVTVIGSNSAIPAHGRHPSAQVVTINDRLYLIDCGEGTQMRFNELGIKWMKINQIFISHLHGDHFFGLIGVLSTYHLMRRNRPLDVYAPAPLADIIKMQLEAGESQLNYELRFHELDTVNTGTIYENEDITVDTIVLNHRIPCVGFVFREKQRDRKVIREKLQEFQIPVELIPDIKKGMDILDEKTGNRILNKDITIDPPLPRTYAYCCDTAYYPAMVPFIANADLVYHDCTFDEASSQRATDTFHSTTKQAASIALQANAKKLMIGHFSSKYDDLLPLLREAQEVFSNTILAIEGKTVELERVTGTP